MRSDELEYELPAELIAQHPASRRDASRLLVYERTTGAVRHRTFAELPDELGEEELVVVNDTRVVPARITGRRATGGAAEVLLLEAAGEAGGGGAPPRPPRRPRAGGPVRGAQPRGAPRRGRR